MLWMYVKYGEVSRTVFPCVSTIPSLSVKTKMPQWEREVYKPT